MKLLPSLLAGALMLGLAGVAEAGTATTTFPVTATVVPACAVSAQNITFPSVGNISSASGFTGVQAQTTLNLECNQTGLSVTVELTTAPMLNATDGKTTIAYGLFQDAGLTTPWGTKALSQAKVIAAAYGQQNLTVYGQIPAQSNVVAGVYSAPVTVNVSY